MLRTFEGVTYQEINRFIVIATKVIVGFLILIYFGAKLVICNEEIPVCDNHFKDLKDDLKNWKKNCLNNERQEHNTSCCQAGKRYHQNRIRVLTKMCFFNGKVMIPLY